MAHKESLLNLCSPFTARKGFYHIPTFYNFTKPKTWQLVIWQQSRMTKNSSTIMHDSHQLTAESFHKQYKNSKRSKIRKMQQRFINWLVSYCHSWRRTKEIKVAYPRKILCTTQARKFEGPESLFKICFLHIAIQNLAFCFDYIQRRNVFSQSFVKPIFRYQEQRPESRIMHWVDRAFMKLERKCITIHFAHC